MMMLSKTSPKLIPYQLYDYNSYHSLTGVHIVSVIVALLGAGVQNKFSAGWAIGRAAQLGYDFQKTRPDVVALFTEVLGDDDHDSSQTSGASRSRFIPDLVPWK